MEEIACELSNGDSSIYDVKHRAALDKFKNEYLKNTSNPLSLIEAHEKDSDKLKEIFEGYPTAVLKIKRDDLKIDELHEIAHTLNENSSDKLYQPIIGDNSESFVIERTLARKVDMKPVIGFVEQELKPLVLQVA
jgi:hypothetical protein